MWFLTIDPFVGIPVFIAKLSERQYCWRVIEDFHSQEYIQFFDIHNCIFMRLHFSTGGYDYRRTTRFRQGIHFSIIQVVPQVQELMQAGTCFPKVRRILLFFSPSISKHFWPASKLLRGHIALAIPSPPETDPQILERWGYAPSEGFWSRILV